MSIRNLLYCGTMKQQALSLTCSESFSDFISEGFLLIEPLFCFTVEFKAVILSDFTTKSVNFTFDANETFYKFVTARTHLFYFWFKFGRLFSLLYPSSWVMVSAE